jgi:hypothetical protein
LIETPAFTLVSNGVLAANGGSNALAGALSNQTSTNPGSGSAGTTLAGVAGMNNTAGPPSGNGYGGGGGAGRIRIENKSGSFSPGGGAVVSPDLSTSAVTVAVVASQ